MDSWGRPFILQVIPTVSGKCWAVVTTEKVCARIISAGKGDGVGTYKELAEIDTDLTQFDENGYGKGDDRILYLNIPTPPGDVNEDCSNY